MARRDLSELRQDEASIRCADQEACAQRAAASGIYPQSEHELEISARESRSGALR
jgi:hypothetical protein